MKAKRRRLFLLTMALVLGLVGPEAASQPEKEWCRCTLHCTNLRDGAAFLVEFNWCIEDCATACAARCAVDATDLNATGIYRCTVGAGGAICDGPCEEPQPPGPDAPQPDGKSLTEGLGANTAAGAGAGALINLATGVGELTVGVGALVSGALGAAGSLFGTLLWNFGRYVVDPPGVVRPLSDWWYWALLTFLVLVIMALLGVRSRQPFVKCIWLSLAIGGLVGSVCGFSLVDSEIAPAIFVLTGLIIGLMDSRVLARGGAGAGPAPDTKSLDR